MYEIYENKRHVKYSRIILDGDILENLLAKSKAYDDLLNRPYSLLCSAGNISVLEHTIQFVNGCGAEFCGQVGLQGKIWFTGCLMRDCLVKPVSIIFTFLMKGKAYLHEKMYIEPGLEPFSFDGFPINGFEWHNVDHIEQVFFEVHYGDRAIFADHVKRGRWLGSLKRSFSAHKKRTHPFLEDNGKCMHQSSHDHFANKHTHSRARARAHTHTHTHTRTHTTHTCTLSTCTGPHF